MSAAAKRISFGVVDKRTRDVIPAAAVFVNGRAVSEYTIRADEKAQVQGKAKGYSGSAFEIDGKNVTSPVTIHLTPDASSVKHDVKVETNPIQASVSVTITGPGGFTGSGVTGSDGSILIKGVPNGTCTVAGEHPDFTVLGGSWEKTNNIGQVLQLQPKTEEGVNTPDEQAPVSGEEDLLYAAERGGAILLDQDVSEQIYGNTSYENYFTSTQCRVYIGNLFIDEMQTIQYTLQANAIPLFGYASRFADAFAEGRSLVQGQIVINYVTDGYLYAALEEYARKMEAKIEPSAEEQQAKQIASFVTYAKAQIASTRVREMVSERMALLASNPDAVRAANKLLRRRGEDPVYANPVYKRQLFDIVIEIGAGTAGRSYRRIEKAKLTTNDQIVDINTGQVIAEAYGFVARRLR